MCVIDLGCKTLWIMVWDIFSETVGNLFSTMTSYTLENYRERNKCEKYTLD